jgi:hypothetical protein
VVNSPGSRNGAAVADHQEHLLAIAAIAAAATTEKAGGGGSIPSLATTFRINDLRGINISPPGREAFTSFWVNVLF